MKKFIINHFMKILGILLLLNIGFFAFNTLHANDSSNPNNNRCITDINNAYQKANENYPMMAISLYVDDPSFESNTSISNQELIDFMNTMMNRGYTPSIVIQPYEKISGNWLIIWNKERYAIWEVTNNADKK